MSDLDREVLKIYKKIEKNYNENNLDRVKDYLRVLSNKPITLETLRTTKIGKQVNQLRTKIDDREIKQSMRNLIKKWKTLSSTTEEDDRPGRQDSNQSTNNQNSNSNNYESNNSNTNNTSNPAQESHNNNHSNNKDKTEDKGSVYVTPIDYCGDPNRDKARDLIGKALRSKFPVAMHSNCNRCAVSLEKGLDELYGNNLKKFKLQLMSKISNLKDDKNPSLRESLINQQISGLELAKMTPADMASDELKAKNEKFKKENLLEHQVAVNQGTETEMFQCGKCKQKKCTYTQLQTRSSDEPMTTFVYCMHCGNRWKFC